MGEVRPFWDRSISERMCEECHRKSEETDVGKKVRMLLSDSQEVEEDD